MEAEEEVQELKVKSKLEWEGVHGRLWHRSKAIETLDMIKPKVLAEVLLLLEETLLWLTKLAKSFIITSGDR